MGQFENYVIYDTGAEMCVSTDNEYENWILESADYNKNDVDRSGYKGTISDLIKELYTPDSSTMHSILGIHTSITIDYEMILEHIENWILDDDVFEYIYSEIKKASEA